jgi:hypothetical protein
LFSNSLIISEKKTKESQLKTDEDDQSTRYSNDKKANIMVKLIVPDTVMIIRPT